MAPTRLADISQAQQERLSHIDFRLRFLGTIGRNDLVSRFGIKAAAATRDITLYKELASQNLEYDTKAKIYTRSEPFSPLFDYSRHQALTALAHGFGDDFVASHKAHIACETPAQLNKPQLDTLSVLTRAIHQKHPVEITFFNPAIRDPTWLGNSVDDKVSESGALAVVGPDMPAQAVVDQYKRGNLSRGSAAA